jgi:transmembrane sensor
MRGPIVYLSLFTIAACHGRSNIRLGDGTRYVNNSGEMQWVTLPDSSRVKLGDRATVVLGAGFVLGNRVVDLDGEGMFEIRPMAGRPFVVTTKNLLIMGPAVRFRVDAVRSRPGEEVDLLEGQLKIRKSYHSDLDSATEELGPGDMLMINREIDLMEKEKMSAAEIGKAKSKF